MDPYRESLNARCPVCTDGGLMREHGGRLVCDNCQGVMLTEHDLVKACLDLNSVALEVAVSDGKPQHDRCPRCGDPMHLARLTLGGRKLKALVLRCSPHGLWLPRAELAHVLAVTTRGGASGLNSHSSGLAGGMGASVNNLDGTQTPSTGSATAGLRIGQWYLRRHRSPSLTPINVYADRTLACPACSTELAFQGDRWSCTQCAGTFLQNDALEGLVLDITGDAWRVPAPTGSPGERACPVCTKPMIAEDLERVPIDRCAEHGLWFDARELAVMLERASGQFEKHGVRAWLAHLF